MYNKLFLILTLCINSCLGMNNQENSSFVEITTAQDMGQFAGQIIAFKTNSNYFEPSKNYVLYNDNPIYFAMVSSTPDTYSSPSEVTKGYQLYRIIKKGANGSICALINSTLSAGFSARRATPEEIEKIYNAIQNKQSECY